MTQDLLVTLAYEHEDDLFEQEGEAAYGRPDESDPEDSV